jgi:hypothetical protein
MEEKTFQQKFGMFILGVSILLTLLHLFILDTSVASLIGSVLLGVTGFIMMRDRKE